MEPKFSQGQFVHVVAMVDLEARTGKILYVNPATVAMEGAGENIYGVELQVNDEAGHVLLSYQPNVRLDACEDADQAKTGLIQEDIPYLPGMKEVVLFMQGQVLNRYVAGEVAPPVADEIVVAGAQPDSPNRRAFSGPSNAERSGVTYTVQARPAGTAAWQTIAVGRAKPDLDVNVNQFPGAQSVNVRVLMTNGFEETVLDEREIAV